MRFKCMVMKSGKRRRTREDSHRGVLDRAERSPGKKQLTQCLSSLTTAASLTRILASSDLAQPDPAIPKLVSHKELKIKTIPKLTKFLINKQLRLRKF